MQVLMEVLMLAHNSSVGMNMYILPSAIDMSVF